MMLDRKGELWYNNRANKYNGDKKWILAFL